MAKLNQKTAERTVTITRNGLEQFNQHEARKKLLRDGLTQIVPEMPQDLKNELKDIHKQLLHKELYDSINNVTEQLVENINPAFKSSEYNSLYEFLKEHPIKLKNLKTEVIALEECLHKREKLSNNKNKEKVALFLAALSPAKHKEFINLLDALHNITFTSSVERWKNKNPCPKQPKPDEVNTLKDTCTVSNYSDFSIQKEDGTQAKESFPDKVSTSNRALQTLLGSDEFIGTYKIKENNNGDLEYIFNTKKGKENFLNKLYKISLQEQEEFDKTNANGKKQQNNNNDKSSEKTEPSDTTNDSSKKTKLDSTSTEKVHAAAPTP